MNHKIKLESIDRNANYEGYLWWSDQQEPVVFLGDEPIELPKEATNPFIIEGNLWDEIKETSYLIRFIDGEYMVYKFELNENDVATLHEYLPNRMPGIDKLKFKEVWEEQPDKLCNDFNVLKPAFIAFVGFEKQEKKQ